MVIEISLVGTCVLCVMTAGEPCQCDTIGEAALLYCCFYVKADDMTSSDSESGIITKITKFDTDISSIHNVFLVLSHSLVLSQCS